MKPYLLNLDLVPADRKELARFLDEVVIRVAPRHGRAPSAPVAVIAALAASAHQAGPLAAPGGLGEDDVHIVRQVLDAASARASRESLPAADAMARLLREWERVARWRPPEPPEPARARQ